MAEKFGMMSEAYFKGKRELLEWARDFLQLDIAKVEDFGKGAEYCQLLDALFPRTMKMSKVNFGARNEPEYVNNWKLIQKVFESQSIQKVIPVQRLIQCRFQDNLEFLQWFHQYFMSTYNGNEYDPEARRARSKGAKSSGISRTRASVPPARAAANAAATRPSSRPVRGGISKNDNGSGRSSNLLQGENEKLKSQLADLKNSVTELESALEAKQTEMTNMQNIATEIETERDFYFAKVVKIEQRCKEENPDAESGEDGLVPSILKILYAADHNDDAKAAAEGNPDGQPTEGTEGVMES